jgi:hypothetical protein
MRVFSSKGLQEKERSFGEIHDRYGSNWGAFKQYCELSRYLVAGSAVLVLTSITTKACPAVTAHPKEGRNGRLKEQYTE